MLLSAQAPIDSFPLGLTEISAPEPGPQDVRIKVSVCAICRTDLHIVEGDLPPAKMPVVPGHQVVGVIDKLGPECSRLREGQRVGIAWLRHTDGTCRLCERGRENLCLDARFTGYHADGGYAEYALVPEDFAYELPEAFSDELASPLLCAGLIGYRSLKRAAVPEKGKLLLIGFGSSAHIIIQIALYRGYRVFVVTRAEGHRKLCLEMGAEWAGERLQDMPVKVDSAILFAPVGELIPPAMQVLDRGGILSLAGIHMSDVPAMNYERDLFYEREIRTVTANTREDGKELLAEAAAAKVAPHVRLYNLGDANQALLDLKQDRINGTGVLVIEPRNH